MGELLSCMCYTLEVSFFSYRHSDSSGNGVQHCTPYLQYKCEYAMGRIWWCSPRNLLQMKRSESLSPRLFWISMKPTVAFGKCRWRDRSRRSCRHGLRSRWNRPRRWYRRSRSYHWIDKDRSHNLAGLIFLKKAPRHSAFFFRVMNDNKYLNIQLEGIN